VLAVGGEFDVHRQLQPLTQQLQERAQPGQKRRIAQQSLERDDRLRVGGIPAEADGPQDAALEHAEDLLGDRVLAPVLREQIGERDCVEAVGLEVDDVCLARCVALDLPRVRVDAQPWLARGDEDRIVVGDAVHGARPQPRDEAQQAVFAGDAR
jgi:hypothetical protein